MKVQMYNRSKCRHMLLEGVWMQEVALWTDGAAHHHLSAQHCAAGQ